MDIVKYLERINYAGPLDGSFEVLSTLQINHLMTVPFENLDIHNHTKIDFTNLFDKIVTRRRGGFCYELNGLFYELLKAVGFTVKMVSARVYNDKKDYSPEFDHLALIVKIKDDHYLVDVGFGEFSSYPVKIELNKETNDPGGIFCVKTFNENYLVIEKRIAEGNWIPEYMFTDKERKLNEFQDRCNFHQTSKESHFMQKRICSLLTKNGRITLSGETLKITENGAVTEREINNEQEFQQALWNYFGIKL